MAKVGFSSVTEQVARHLEDGLRRGRWSVAMPGRGRLVEELGVSGKTVELALERLEQRGFLAAAEVGKRRRILVEPGTGDVPQLRVGILPYEAVDRGLPYLIDMRHRLEEAGHLAAFAPRSLMELKRDSGRVAELVGRDEADAWVVMGGPREVIEWFASQPVPAFALFGRRRGVPIAGGGPDKVPAMREVVRQLVTLGHRRIVLFVREERRKPQPGPQERAFLEELVMHGISTGLYHLPDWEETPEGLLHCIDGFFDLTPPTALILDETFLFAAAQQHLAQRGIQTPRDVSLVCCDPPEATLAWMRPSVAHIRWDHRPVVRRILQWAANVSRGQKDLRQTETKAEFVPDGTIGPVK